MLFPDYTCISYSNLFCSGIALENLDKMVAVFNCKFDITLSLSYTVCETTLNLLVTFLTLFIVDKTIARKLPVVLLAADHTCTHI